MTDKTLTIIDPNSLIRAATVANRIASEGVFDDYRQRAAANTLRRQAADLHLFERYLQDAGVFVCDLAANPECWRGMTWGIVAGFVQWQLKEGYAIGSINVRLATIKRYTQLAHASGAISTDDYTRIQTVKGYGHKQASKVDEKRKTTRIEQPGAKKAEAVSISKEQAKSLKAQPDTPQGRRDTLIMCLLLDHGMRCGEIAALNTTDFDLDSKTFTFYRKKVQKTQTHRITKDTMQAATAYIKNDASPTGKLLKGSRKSGLTGSSGAKLSGEISDRSINERVGLLGRAIGIDALSPHDCRHYWATQAARHGTDPFVLQEAGGWSSLAMPRRYIDDAKIANEGVKLD